MDKTIRVEALDGPSFSDYGGVIDYRGASVCGTSALHDYWDTVASFCAEGKQICSFLRTRKTLSDPVEEMERHLDTQELLLALDGDAVITVAKADNNAPDPNEETMRCFCMKQGTGVIFDTGAWHALPLTLNESSMLLVIFRENTSYSKDATVDTDIFFAKLKRALILNF